MVASIIDNVRQACKGYGGTVLQWYNLGHESGCTGNGLENRWDTHWQCCYTHMWDHERKQRPTSDSLLSKMIVVIWPVEGTGCGRDGNPGSLSSLMVMMMSWEETGLINVFPHVENRGDTKAGVIAGLRQAVGAIVDFGLVWQQQSCQCSHHCHSGVVHCVHRSNVDA